MSTTLSESPHPTPAVLNPAPLTSGDETAESHRSLLFARTTADNKQAVFALEVGDLTFGGGRPRRRSECGIPDGLVRWGYCRPCRARGSSRRRGPSLARRRRDVPS